MDYSAINASSFAKHFGNDENEDSATQSASQEEVEQRITYRTEQRGNSH